MIFGIPVPQESGPELRAPNRVPVTLQQRHVEAHICKR